MKLRFLYLIFILLTPIQIVNANLSELTINPLNEEYTRLSSGLSGSNITIISAEEISLNQSYNLPQIIEKYSGIEVRRLFGGVDGTNSTFDIRGFGEAAGSNSLILVNGEKLNDIDMSSVDFNHIPLSAIQRIEIIRGGSAATIYGSGAVGGAINVVTKNKIDTNSLATSLGSYNSVKGEILVSEYINNDLITFSSKYLDTNTYRSSADYENSSFLLNYQVNLENLKINFNGSNATIDQLLPGPRVIGGHFNYHLCNLYSSSHTAKHIGGSFATNGNSCNDTQRDDYANSEKFKLGISGTYEINSLNKIFFHTGYKDKTQKSFFAANGNTSSTPNNGDRYINTTLDGNNLNLRYENKEAEEGYSNIFNIGFDIGHSFYSSTRHRKEDEQMGQNYDADQKVYAFYFQNTLDLNQYSTSISFGARTENTDFGGRDEVNRGVTGFSFATDHDTYDIKRSNIALNIGFEKRIGKYLSIFSNYSEAFRVPNIDERIKATTSGSFALNDQESENIEIGIRSSLEKSSFNLSFYKMDTINEIQYDQSKNTNLDPIERTGVNLDFEHQIDKINSVSGSLSITNAEFTSGTLTPGTGGASSCNFDNTTYCSNSLTWQNRMGGGTSYSLVGKSVPLVSPLKYSIDYQRKIKDNLFLEFELKYTDKRYVSNDQENIEPMIPDYYLVNAKIRNEYGPYNFSLGIDNLFNKAYYDFAVSSTFHDDNHYGTQSVYPLPERNFYFDFKYTF